MNHSSESILSADRPLINPDSDRLGYDALAARLASTIVGMSPTDGLTVSVCGQNGIGKSTILNLIDHHLKTGEWSMPIEGIHFNPFYFSGTDSIVVNFFANLIVSLDPHEVTLRKVRELLSLFQHVIIEGPKREKDPSQLRGLLDKGMAARAMVAAELKSKLREIMSTLKRRFVLLIDDVDRLTPEEIRQFLKLIHTVVDLPNFIYILAFDKYVVSAALDEFHQGFGSAYIEKVIQVSFDLPFLEKLKLRKFLFERLDISLGHMTPVDFDQHYWGAVYLDGIEPLINTPRDVIRLSNSLAVTFPSVKGLVNPVDFIAMEAIRVFAPKLYDEIRQNPEEFAGQPQRALEYGIDQQKDQLEWYLDLAPSHLRKPMNTLLQLLFPRLESERSERRFGSDDEVLWRRERRVCSIEVFPDYFKQGMPEGNLGLHEVKNAVYLTADPTGFHDYLLELSSQPISENINKAHLFLKQVEDFIHHKIPKTIIKRFILNIYDVSDELCRTEPSLCGFFDFGIGVQLARISHKLLKKLNKKECFELLSQAVESCKSLGTIVREIAYIGQLHGKNGTRERLHSQQQIVSQEDLRTLETLVSRRIQDEARAGNLAEATDLSVILSHWREWQEAGECDAWLSTQCADSGFVVSLVSSIAHHEGISTSKSAGGFGYRMESCFLSEGFDLPKAGQETITWRGIIEKTLGSENLTDRERLFLEQHLKSLDQNRGKKKPKALKEAQRTAASAVSPQAPALPTQKGG